MKIKNEKISSSIGTATEYERLVGYLSYLEFQITAYYQLGNKNEKYLKAIRHNCKLVSKMFEEKGLI